MAVLSTIVGVLAAHVIETVLGVIILLLTGALWVTKCRFPGNPVPGPSGTWVVGSTPELLRNMHRVNDWLWEQTKTYGRTWKMELFGRPATFVTSDPANVEHILKGNFDNYVKGQRFRSTFHDLLGDGIFNTDGHNWYTQRKTASNMFSVRNFREHMGKIFVSHGNEVLDRLSRTNGDAFDLQDLMYRYTLDSITEIAFGVNVRSLQSTEPVPFAKAFDTASSLLVLGRVPFPVKLWKFARFIGTPGERQIKECTKHLDAFAAQVIQNRKAQIEAGAVYHDLLSLFLRSGEYSDVYLRDMIMNFVIAGRDTTAIALGWSFYCLYTNPQAEKKLIEEVDSVLHGEPPTYDSVKALTYTQAVFYETLRLYPPVPKNVKTAVHDDVLPDGTFVPSGSVVLYSQYLMGRDAQLWDDPLMFKPERWINSNGEFVQPSPFVYQSFHAGPRLCLGKQMATTEAVMLLALVVPRFEIRPIDPSARIQHAPTLTLAMSQGHHVRAVPRATQTAEGTA